MGTDSRPVLLIGASGLLGSGILSLLTECEIPTRVLVRQGTPPPPGTRADCVVGDLLTGKGLKEAVSDVRTVLYFAGTSVPALSANDPALDLSTSLPPLVSILNVISRHNPAARFVFPSTGGSIYGECHSPANEATPARPMSAYALGKTLAEEIIRFYERVFDVRNDILRISNVYGSSKVRRIPQGVIDRFLDDALCGEESQIWGSLDIRRDYVFVDDISKAVVELVQHPDRPSGLYNIGQSKSNSLTEVLEIIGNVTQGRHRYKFSLRNYEGIQRSELDCSQIERTLSWKPATGLEEGIRLTWERKIRARRPQYGPPRPNGSEMAEKSDSR